MMNGYYAEEEKLWMGTTNGDIMEGIISRIIIRTAFDEGNFVELNAIIPRSSEFASM